MSQTFSGALEKIINKTNLNADEALWLMNETMSGNLTPAQIAAWLVAMRVKGETSLEISTFALVMREKAVSLTSLSLPEPLLDTCGTGGDKSNLVNISTLSAIVLASREIRVAKHGNRSVSSSSGSADFLERAGYPLNATPESIVNRIKNKNFGFFFAPSFHPAMKFAGPVRKEIGIRTVFNVLGPLSNPAHAKIHMMGVFSHDYIKIMAEALEQLGTKTFLVVHSSDGLDEISPKAKTNYCLYHSGSFKYDTIDPVNFKFKINELSELTVKNGDEAYELGLKILSGSHESGAEMVAINAAAGEYLWELHLNKTSEDLQTYLIHKTQEIKKMILGGHCKPEKVLHE
ncbi:MAG: anthranilate phosphoribosyltransferase [Spirochaetia bacterium]|nr:anthranilate phosphoribosyltransferase [Spirochaetia bacterium]